MKVIRIVAALAALLIGGPAAWSADLPTIRLGWVVAPGSTAALLMMKPDASVHRNVTYKFEPMHFVSTAVELAPFASNQVDIIDMSYSAIGAAIDNAHLTDLRIVADEIQNGIYGHENGSGFLVLKDGPIKTFDDLKGKAVAVLTIGSATDMQARIMMRRHGLEDKRDYNIIEAQFANMKSLLTEGKAAMVAIAPPFAFDPELRAKSRMFFTETDAMGPTQLLSLAARKSYIDAHRAVLVDFFEDVIRTVRWFTDPEESRSGDPIGCGDDQAAGGPAGAALHQGRQLPRPQCRAQSRLAAAQPRSAAQDGHPEDRDRHQEICGSQPRPRGGETAQMKPALHPPAAFSVK